MYKNRDQRKSVFIALTNEIIMLTKIGSYHELCARPTFLNPSLAKLKIFIFKVIK